MSRQYANRPIQAGRIRAEMVPIVSKLGLPEPAIEAQLRELARLPSPEERVEVYREAVGRASAGGKVVTARVLHDVIGARTMGIAVDEKPRLAPSERLSRARLLLDRLRKALRDAGIRTAVLEELRELLATRSSNSSASLV